MAQVDTAIANSDSATLRNLFIQAFSADQHNAIQKIVGSTYFKGLTGDDYKKLYSGATIKYLISNYKNSSANGKAKILDKVNYLVSLGTPLDEGDTALYFAVAYNDDPLYLAF